MCEIPLSVGLERIHWGRFDETVSAEIYGLNLIMFVIMTSYLQNALKPRFVVAILRVFYLLSSIYVCNYDLMPLKCLKTKIFWPKDRVLYICWFFWVEWVQIFRIKKFSEKFMAEMEFCEIDPWRTTPVVQYNMDPVDLPEQKKCLELVVTKGANFSKKKSFECFSQMLFDK
jgi:hypothetical protein